VLDSGFIDRNARVIFPLPAVLFVVVMMVFPVAYTLTLSFTNWNLASVLPPRFVGFKTYAAILGEQRFWAALLRTFYFTAVAITAETLLGVIWALVLKRKFFAKGTVKLLLLLPMMATPVAIGIAWTLFYEPTIGLANWVLKAFALNPLNWIADKHLVIPSLAIVDIWQWTPMITLIVLAGLASLSSEPYESARVDGANGWQIFWRITLPMIAPTILTALILRSIDALKTYDIIYSMTNGGPGFASETLNIYAYSLSFTYFRIGNASATLVFLFLVVLSFSLGVTRLRRRLSS